MLKALVRQSIRAVDAILGTDYYSAARNRLLRFHDASYRFEQDEIAFVHVPKTGGSSLHAVLKRDPARRFINLDMHRPISKWCDPSNYRYITILRDPVDRVWSYYQMILNGPAHYPYKKSAVRGLDYFLDHCWEARNMSVRYYSGEIDQTPTALTLAKARKNLKKFCAVIRFEVFEGDVRAFSSQFGLHLESLPHERKSSYSPPTQADRNIILAVNSLDVALVQQWRENVSAPESVAS